MCLGFLGEAREFSSTRCKRTPCHEGRAADRTLRRERLARGGFLADAQAREGPVPGLVERELRAFLACGILDTTPRGDNRPPA